MQLTNVFLHCVPTLLPATCMQVIYFGLTLTDFMKFFFQIKTVDLSSSSDCLSKFKSNKWLGLILFAGIMAGTLVKMTTEKEEMEEAGNKTRL